MILQDEGSWAWRKFCLAKSSTTVCSVYVHWMVLLFMQLLELFRIVLRRSTDPYNQSPSPRLLMPHDQHYNRPTQLMVSATRSQQFLDSERSEVPTRAQTSRYGFWVYISRASKFSSLLFSETQATSPGAAASKVLPSLKVIMQGLHSTIQLDCAHPVNQYLRVQK